MAERGGREVNTEGNGSQGQAKRTDSRDASRDGSRLFRDAVTKISSSSGGGAAMDRELCVGPHGQATARYEPTADVDGLEPGEAYHPAGSRVSILLGRRRSDDSGAHLARRWYSPGGYRPIRMEQRSLFKARMSPLTTTGKPLLLRRSWTRSDNDPSSSEWVNDLYEGSATTAGGTVFIRNLPPFVTDEQVAHHFGQVGRVCYVKLDVGPLVTATVGFLKRHMAARAVETLHLKSFHGRQLKVADTSPSLTPPPDPVDRFVGRKRSSSASAAARSSLRSDRPPVSVFERLK